MKKDCVLKFRKVLSVKLLPAEAPHHHSLHKISLHIAANPLKELVLHGCKWLQVMPQRRAESLGTDDA